LYEFNKNVNLIYHAYPITDAPELTSDTYMPGGRTALHDAIYRAVTETAEYVDELDPNEQPDNVVIVILTDGKENVSETHQERVREQVKIRSDEHGWKFLFIGANQDAALTAESVGIDRDRSLNMAHNDEGTQSAYESTSEQISQTRREGTSDGFDEVDRKKQEEARDP
jgi:SepF-like predicted cell division protein (DUF552 family)